MSVYEKEPILPKGLIKGNIKEAIELLAILAALTAFIWSFCRDKILPTMAEHHEDKVYRLVGQKENVR